MMAWSCCRNCSAADDGCAFGGRHRPLLQRGGCAGAASWPTRSVLGVRRLFGAGSRNIGGGNAVEVGDYTAIHPRRLDELDLPARAQGTQSGSLPTAHGKTVSRCGSTLLQFADPGNFNKGNLGALQVDYSGSYRRRAAARILFCGADGAVPSRWNAKGASASRTCRSSTEAGARRNAHWSAGGRLARRPQRPRAMTS